MLQVAVPIFAAVSRAQLEQLDVLVDETGFLATNQRTSSTGKPMHSRSKCNNADNDMYTIYGARCTLPVVHGVRRLVAGCCLSEKGEGSGKGLRHGEKEKEVVHGRLHLTHTTKRSRGTAAVGPRNMRNSGTWPLGNTLLFIPQHVRRTTIL